MKSIPLSDFLKREIKPFLLGAFLSRIMVETVDGKEYFYAYTGYRASTAVYRDDFDFCGYAQLLADAYNHHSGFYNWEIHRVTATTTELRFYVFNDVTMPKSMFYKALYQKIISSDWILDESFNEQKKDFIRGFFEPRGSVDTTAKLIAQDYFFDNRIELKKCQLLTDMMNIPISYVNLNARNLQPQYVSGTIRRNTQFRIHAFYYAREIGFINKYKALVFKNAYYTKGEIVKQNIIYYDVDMPNRNNDDVVFVRYLNFFTNNIYEKELTSAAVTDLRKRLGFTADAQPLKGRNQTIVTLYNEISQDKCAICGTTKTYENKKNGRQYFEIHHMISYHNGQDFDNIANLVKLCPSCHRMMKKNSGTKESQIKAIIKILHTHAEIYEFASSYLNIDDINDLAEKIWSMLG